MLTVMGLGRRGRRHVAVIIALTLLPRSPSCSVSGCATTARPEAAEARRKPKPPSRPRRVPAPLGAHRHPLPVVTIVGVLAVLLARGRPGREPASSALPDNSTAPTSSTQRQTYDKITAAFGEGYNAPLSIAADVIASTDPKGTVSKLSDAVKGVPDVVAVTQATPNSGADTALIQAIPSAGQTATSTSDLVRELRKRAPGWRRSTASATSWSPVRRRSTSTSRSGSAGRCCRSPAS